MAEAADIEIVDVPYGTLMVGDGEYLYFAHRANSDEDGLYRAKLPIKNVEKIDSGTFSALYLFDHKLYYIAEEDGSASQMEFRCFDTQTLTVATVPADEYGYAMDSLIPEWHASMPDDVTGYVVVGDKAYCMEPLEDIEMDSVLVKDPIPGTLYSLSTIDEDGQTVQTGITWQHRYTMSGVMNAYGDYVIYSRPWEEDPEADDLAHCRDMPCIYDTKTGEETILARKRSIQVGVYVVGASSGYLLVGTLDRPTPEEALYLESISDKDVSIRIRELVENATPTQELAAREEAERAAEEEALRNEPYGPGTSTLHLSAPEDKSACYRLVRMDGSTEFMVLLGPGETTVEKFPSGRYTLKTAEGDTWISDEEAFGPDGHYSTTDVFYFEDGGSYEISSGTKGDFRKDSAGGFTG